MIFVLCTVRKHCIRTRLQISQAKKMIRTNIHSTLCHTYTSPWYKVAWFKFTKPHSKNLTAKKYMYFQGRIIRHIWGIYSGTFKVQERFYIFVYFLFATLEDKLWTLGLIFTFFCHHWAFKLDNQRWQSELKFLKFFWILFVCHTWGQTLNARTDFYLFLPPLSIQSLSSRVANKK